MSHYKAILDSLTEAQRYVMDRLGVDDGSVLEGVEGRANRKAVRGLVKLGLLDTWTEGTKLPGWPPVTVIVPKYSMPIAVHIAWCEWVSEHLTDDERALLDAQQPPTGVSVS